MKQDKPLPSGSLAALWRQWPALGTENTERTTHNHMAKAPDSNARQAATPCSTVLHSNYMHSKTAQRTKGSLAPPPPPPPPNLQETCWHDFGHTCPENAHLRHMSPSQWLLLHWTKLSTSLFHSKENASATHKLQTNNIFRQERFTVQECAAWKGKVQSTSIT